jgi:uncharacterized SAM-binding protein YcdF (DUF218 family)
LTPPKVRILRWVVPAAILIVVVLTHQVWLRALGGFLVSAQDPFKADMVVALAGDDTGNRILTAAQLVKEGYAPRVLVSGPPCCYGRRESDLAIEFATRQGSPAGWFIPFPIRGNSTVAEAHEIVPELDRLHVGRFIIVTSNYHTRRAANVYGKLVPGERFRLVAAPDPAYRPEDWWRSRDARKTWFLEWAKTLANWAGL